MKKINKEREEEKKKNKKELLTLKQDSRWYG